MIKIHTSYEKLGFSGHVTKAMKALPYLHQAAPRQAAGYSFAIYRYGNDIIWRHPKIIFIPETPGPLRSLRPENFLRIAPGQELEKTTPHLIHVLSHDPLVSSAVEIITQLPGWMPSTTQFDQDMIQIHLLRAGVFAIDSLEDPGAEDQEDLEARVRDRNHLWVDLPDTAHEQMAILPERRALTSFFARRLKINRRTLQSTEFTLPPFPRG